MYTSLTEHAALVICGVSICGFEYPRIIKWAKTADNKGKLGYLCITRPKMVDLVFAVHEFLRNVTPANNKGHLYFKNAMFVNGI